MDNQPGKDHQAILSALESSEPVNPVGTVAGDRFSLHAELRNVRGFHFLSVRDKENFVKLKQSKE